MGYLQGWAWKCLGNRLAQRAEKILRGIPQGCRAGMLNETRCVVVIVDVVVVVVGVVAVVAAEVEEHPHFDFRSSVPKVCCLPPSVPGSPIAETWNFGSLLRK